VPAPVAVLGKKSNRSVPAAGVAPPPPDPNGSLVVLATEIPVSNGPTLSASGINSVVLAGTILTTVIGPTSSWINVGYPAAAVGRPNAVEVSLLTATPIGTRVAVTLMAPAVVTAAVLFAVTVA